MAGDRYRGHKEEFEDWVKREARRPAPRPEPKREEPEPKKED
jgi:hypothetical protein